jgi:hypothetical protein
MAIKEIMEALKEVPKERVVESSRTSVSRSTVQNVKQYVTLGEFIRLLQRMQSRAGKDASINLYDDDSSDNFPIKKLSVTTDNGLDSDGSIHIWFNGDDPD